MWVEWDKGRIDQEKVFKVIRCHFVLVDISKDILRELISPGSHTWVTLKPIQIVDLPDTWEEDQSWILAFISSAVKSQKFKTNIPPFEHKLPSIYVYDGKE